MMQILHAEHLKMKRTMILKLLIIAPVINIFISFLSGSYFYACAFNWWYTMFYPVIIALICSQIQEKEKKKLNYQNIWMSPIPFKKMWWGKSLLAAGYSLLTCMIMTIITIVVSLVTGFTIKCSIRSATVAGVIIFLTCCFEIPIYMYLAKRFNFVVTCITAVIFVTLGIAFGEKSNWIIIPFTYCNRTMYKILGIMINGLFLSDEKSGLIVTWPIIVLTVVISCGLFVLGTILSSKIVESEDSKK